MGGDSEVVVGVASTGRSVIARGISAVAIVFAAALLGAAPAYATPVGYYASPSGTGASCSGTTPCTLTEALTLAAGAGNDGDPVTINLGGGTYTDVADTISTGGESLLTITGGSAASTILKGDGSDVTLGITSTFIVTVSNLTIENGSAGDGYGDNLDADGGTVNAEDDVFTGDTDDDFDGSVAVNGGTLNLTDSTITGVSGTAVIGLAVAGAGNATVTDSTVSDNAGFGVDAYGTGAVSVVDSTIADNTGEGVSDLDSSEIMYITGSTLTGNARGVVPGESGAQIDLAGDLLASNGTADCGTASGGTIFDAGYDYSDDTTCPITSGTSHNGETDAALAVGALSPNTRAPQTENLGAASVAHDVVPDSIELNGASHDFCAAPDERGAYRSQGGGTTCDAGASQIVAAVVYYASPVGSGSCLSAGAACSIATAATDAEASRGAVTINLAAGTYSLTGAPGVVISGETEYSLAIDGAGEQATVLQGNGSNSLMRVVNSSPVTVENLTLENGGDATSGANCYAGYGEDFCANNSTVTLLDVTATSSANGGGDSAIVDAYSGNLSVEGSTVSGGVDATGVSFQFGSDGPSTGLVEDSTIQGNALYGVADDSSNVDIETSTITANSLGGAVTFDPGAGAPFLTIFGSTLAGNSGGDGIGFYAGTIELGGDLLAANGTFTDCNAQGGTLLDDGYNYSDDSSCIWTAGTSFDNEATLGLGGLATNGGPTETQRIASTSEGYDVIPLAAQLNGQTFCAESDQRGVARDQGAATACDAGAYQYAPPIVASLSASTLEPGQTLTINGSRLAGVTTATFGAAPATIDAQSNSSLTLTVPSVAAGSEPITLTNADDSAVVAFTVIADPTLATSALAGGEVGAAYSQTLSVSGGGAPYSFAIVSGSLPAGLTLSSGGVISGTPSSAGEATFAVRVSDAHGVSSPPQTLTITVAAAGMGTPALEPSLNIASSTLKLSHGHLPVKLSCEQAACDGTLSVTETVTKKVKGHSKKTVVTLANADYNLSPGQTETIKLALGAKGRSLLTHASKHHVHATLKATVSGGAAVTQAATIS
jgi:hypothetical protein